MWNVAVCASIARSCQASVSNQALAIDLMSARRPALELQRYLRNFPRNYAINHRGRSFSAEIKLKKIITICTTARPLPRARGGENPNRMLGCIGWLEGCSHHCLGAKVGANPRFRPRSRASLATTGAQGGVPRRLRPDRALRREHLRGFPPQASVTAAQQSRRGPAPQKGPRPAGEGQPGHARAQSRISHSGAESSAGFRRPAARRCGRQTSDRSGTATQP